MGCKVIHKTVMALSCTLLLTAWTAPAHAQESNEKAAREMVEGVLRNTEKSRTGDLGAWSRGVIKRALKRTGENTSQTPAPLPAEAQADRLAGSLSTPARGPEVIVFMSLAVPEASWREWSLEAARAGVTLVLRGLAPGGLKATVKRVGALLAEGAGAAIDPRPFRLFGIEVIPAVAVVPGGVPPCKSRGCAADPAPPHDRIRGNIGLEAALSIIAAEGGPGRETARRHLERLRGDRP